MTSEKEQIQARAMARISDELISSSNNSTFKLAAIAVNEFCNNPDKKMNASNVSKNAMNIRELFIQISEWTKALDDLKSKCEFAIASTYELPGMAKNFTIRDGAKSIKCDHDENSMRNLMDKFKGLGYDPCALFEKCSAITAKKAADAFGLSEQVFLETYGDLFETHKSKPVVKAK